MKLRSLVHEFLSLEEQHRVKPRTSEKPLREQIYTRDQLSDLGGSLAEQDNSVVSSSASRELRKRFNENRKLLEQAYFTLAEAARERETLSPGAEWLLDNYHIVEQQIKEIKTYFPSGYDRTLPKQKSGPSQGYPRVYHLALQVITHSDALVDTELLGAFIGGYQSSAPLTIGELWAVPIMLKFALLENLRRLISAIVDSRVEKRAAEVLINDVFDQNADAGTDFLLRLAKTVETRPSLLSKGAVHLLRRLREQGPKASLSLQWLEQKLRDRGFEPEDLLREDYQNQAFDQVSIGNSVTSLKTMSTIEWRTWVEEMSKVNSILRRDPAGVYSQCDFTTRDHYRHRIERLARNTSRTEIEVAEKLIEVAAKTPTGRTGHVGYYLIDEGRREFASQLGVKVSVPTQISRFFKQSALFWYLGGVLLLTMLGVFVAVNHSIQNGAGFGLAVATGLLFLFPASDIAHNLVQWIVSQITTPFKLPKLSYEHGIPDSQRTLVAVHGIYDEPLSLEKTIEGLQVRFLGNEDDNLFYAVLADLKDANAQKVAGDDEIIANGNRLIAELNAQYPSDGFPRFHILFRERKWNPVEGVYMAWERKRGKGS